MDRDNQARNVTDRRQQMDNPVTVANQPGRRSQTPVIEYTSLIQNNRGTTDNDPAGRVYPPDFLPYPKDYFHPLSGCIPNSTKDAERLWQYRKNRNTDGLSDRPDGAKMLREIQQTRESLRKFVVDRYKDGIRDIARDKGLLMPGRTSHPVTLSDVRDILMTLECTKENMNLVYELVYQFHRERSWLAKVIDAWLWENKMYMLKQTKPMYNKDNKRTRNSLTDRGGFSAVGRSAKSQAVGGLMAPMLRKAEWSLSLTEGQSSDNMYKKFWYKPKEMFYLVTQKQDKTVNPGEESLLSKVCILLCVLDLQRVIPNNDSVLLLRILSRMQKITF